jgi:hypothetical protein
MLNKKNSLLLGVLLSTMITVPFVALSSQISEKASAQGKTANVTNSSASMMMVNKTAALHDVLMNKVRSMGNLTANITSPGIHNMTR